MDKRTPIGKYLTIGIVLLLVGTSIIPLAAYKREDTQANSLIDNMVIRNIFPNMIYQKNSLHMMNLENESPSFQLKTFSFIYRNDVYPQCRNREIRGAQRSIGQKHSLSSGFSSLSEQAKGNYTSHDPIRIEGDDEFTAENGVSSGSGTINDPYIIEGWEIFSSSDIGIVILHTRSYFLVRNCLLESYFGVVTHDVTNGTFDNIVYICIDGVGLQLEESSNIVLCNLTIIAWGGLQAVGLSSVTISNCNFSCSDPGGYGKGIDLQDSSFINLSNINVRDFYSGIFMIFTPFSTIADCEVFDNRYGIILGGSPHQTLKRNHLYNNTCNLDIEGLLIEGHTIDEYYQDIDQSNTINGKPVYYLYNQSHLVFDETSEIGFLGLVHCSDITVKNMAITNTGVGVLFVATSDSSVSLCTFTDCYTAVAFVYGSQRNVIENCHGPAMSIFLGWSSDNILRNNTLRNYAFSMQGDTLQDFYQDIDLSNSVNGKPMYYLVEKKNQDFKESNVGYLAFINCKNIDISNVNISGIYDGVLLVHSRVIIRHCTFSYNELGIHIINKSYAWIYDSKISSNSFGIEFDRSSSVAVVTCDISENMVGLDFYDSYDIIIRDCDISHNMFNAFQITNSQYNLICSNTIISNQFGGINMYGDCRGNEILNNTISYGNTAIIMLQDTPLFADPDQILLNPQKNTIRNNDIHHMAICGIGMDPMVDKNVLRRNNIHENQDGILFFSCEDNNTIINNNFYRNAIGVQAWGCNITARKNWWGNATGPSGIGNGTGDPVVPGSDASIMFEPWLQKAVDTEPFVLQYILAILRIRIHSMLT
jgi:parallel beta-helix repeat protein